MRSYSDTHNVKDELYNRIIRVFSNGVSVYFGFSGGKDSLVIAQALFELLKQNRISAKQLIVLFVDEEAIYPCVERIVKSWRTKFMLIGVKFYWLCMEFKHFNCFNQLSQDESFITWDHTKRDVWVRDMPLFAMTSHPLFKYGMSYQEFLKQIRDGIQIVGIRANESIQREKNLASSNFNIHTGGAYYFYPIYDWTLNDVFLFLAEKNVEIPEAYLYMWKSGVSKIRLRISQFFSIDTAATLVRMMEFYPGLYEKVLAREPNAYLAMYYWDSELFRRSSSRRKRLEAEQKINWREKFYDKLRNYEDPSKQEYKKVVTILTKYSGIPLSDKVWRGLYEILVAGDPKARSIRSVYSEIGRYYKEVSHQ
jgi:predicted phosphoadenosine phosphosulfate sulfurtransferase